MGYSFRLAAIVLLYAPPHRQKSPYHGLCGALAGIEIDQCIHCEGSIMDLHLAPIDANGFTWEGPRTKTLIIKLN